MIRVAISALLALLVLAACSKDESPPPGTPVSRNIGVYYDETEGTWEAKFCGTPEVVYLTSVSIADAIGDGTPLCDSGLRNIPRRWRPTEVAHAACVLREGAQYRLSVGAVQGSGWVTVTVKGGVVVPAPAAARRSDSCQK